MDCLLAYISEIELLYFAYLCLGSIVTFDCLHCFPHWVIPPLVGDHVSLWSPSITNTDI